MTTPTYAAGAIERLSTATAAMDALGGPIDAGRPWPVRLVEGEGPEAEWGPPEVLAHAAEVLPYWLGEIERVLAGAPEPVPFGRTTSDPLRNLTIERDRSLPTGELLGRIRVAVGRYAARLPTLSADDWDRRGLHPRLGELAVAAMLERFVVSHLEEHAAQLTAALGGQAPAS